MKFRALNAWTITKREEPALQTISISGDAKTTAAGPHASAALRCEVERISFRNEDNGWSVLKVAPLDAAGLTLSDGLTAVGILAAVHVGELFEFHGTYADHPQYGKQFRIERAVQLRPTSIPAIEKYLASGVIRGIGPKTAKLVCKHFGQATLEILDSNPTRLLEVPGIGKKKAEGAISAWKEQRGVADVMMFLSAHDITQTFAARIFKAYGHEAVRLVSKDPYRLASDIQGIGFKNADRIAQSVGIDKDSPMRIKAAALHILSTGEDRGHCYLTAAQILTQMVSLLELPVVTIEAHLAAAIDDLEMHGSIVCEQLTEASGEMVMAHYRSDLLAAEITLKDQLARLISTPMPSDADRIELWLKRYIVASGTTLSKEQLDAVRLAAASRVFILTGGPGVGKTTTANAIIRLIKAMGKSVALAAPTGRAAQRLTEVAAMPARTIHRLLEWQPNLNGFAKDESNPLNVQAIVVDEASMLDVRLADALLRACGKDAQLILIGDVDQLPSVGPGNVLRDLIESQCIPTARLTQVFRQAAQSLIVQTAHAINRGERPELSNDNSKDCRLIECQSSDEVRMVLRQLLGGVLQRDFGFDPVTDVQVLTPMNRGELGTIALNAELSALLNPEPEPANNRRTQALRPGDRVIQNANNYDLNVFNGDIGYVQHTGLEGNKTAVKFADGRLITYDNEQAMDLRLAYAITIHKSQGSEFPVVLIPCTMQHFVMLQRNLIYTALTRARKLAIFVGAKKALWHAISNQTSLGRQTGLVRRLQNSLRT